MASGQSIEVKVCGVRTVADAEMCVAAGVNAIGIKFWPGTPRCCDERTALSIVQAVSGRVEIVGVFVDADLAEIKRVREVLGIEWVQLHGSEPPEFVQALLPQAYKALRVMDAQIVQEARRFPGERLLL